MRAGGFSSSYLDGEKEEKQGGWGVREELQGFKKHPSWSQKPTLAQAGRSKIHKAGREEQQDEHRHPAARLPDGQGAGDAHCHPAEGHG